MDTQYRTIEGIAANVVPARAKVSLDFRFPTGITKEGKNAVQEKMERVKANNRMPSLRYRKNFYCCTYDLKGRTVVRVLSMPKESG